ncbi:MAG: class II fructose-bisphosphate aldolase family protein [Anaerolineales bacterium]
MPLVGMLDVLQPAMEKGYAVGAFNADNLEMVQAFVRAAEIDRSPLILQVSQGAIMYAGFEETSRVATFMAERSDVPVVVHLDHGKDYPQNVQALRFGVSSLGVDTSMLPYDENVSVSKRVADLAHSVGLQSEAGIGYVPAHDEGLSAAEVELAMTDPIKAEKFVSETGADFIAVALGSMRSMRKREITLDIDRLKELRKRISIPFVLHGSSGVLWKSIQEAIQLGIAKVNLAACFDRRFVEVLRQELGQDQEGFNFRRFLAPAREAVFELAREQYRLLGSSQQV